MNPRAPAAVCTDMPTFITIGYGDRAGYDRTDPSVRDAAHAHDARLRENGALMGIAGTPTQVRNPGGAGTETTDRPVHARRPARSPGSR